MNDLQRDTIPFLPIAGTWAWRGSSAGQWYHPASPWSNFMVAHGFHTLTGPDGRGFVWSTDVNGQQFWRRWFGRKPHTTDWEAGGQNLLDWLVPPLAPDRRQPPTQTHLIAHSHGLQVVLFACAAGLKVNNLISVGSPVREDLMAVGQLARRNISYWQHFHSDCSDRWQWLGEIGDGRVGVVRRHPLADLNHDLMSVGHSGILTNPDLFPAWRPALDIVRLRHGRSDFPT